MSLIVHPEYKKLKDRLSNLIIEHELLKSQICPELERRYLINFGVIEVELYKRDVLLSKLKRELQLIMIQINNESEIDMDLINEKLEKEFEEYEENIQKQIDELNKIDKYDRKHMSDEDFKRLKMIYKQCVLKLHPDLNKNQNEFEKNLFHQITYSFKEGDLERMEALYYLIPDGDIEQVSDIDRLKKLIMEIKLKIKKIKEEYPYNKKELLSSEKNMEEYRNNLYGLLEQFNEEIARYKLRINELI